MTDQPVLTAPPHLNKGLFADYYLNDIVPTLPEWDDALFNEARTALETLRTLRQTLHPELLDEAQLEQLWIKPVLDALGQHYSVQVKIRYRESNHRKPDYVFVATADEVRALTSEVYDPPQIAHALAVGDAKRWGANLDQTPKGRNLSNERNERSERNPSQQIDEYLRYSELTWGILTDGRFWRLYHRDTSKYNTYYAVDLEHLLDANNPHAFLYFYAFFRRAAFTTGWLNKVLAGSEDFAQKLTDKLEDEVYDALEMLAQGFLDYRRNGLTPDPATLRTIYEQSLVLLYRLLFIFYAESREILPIHNPAYRTISMMTLRQDAANALHFNEPRDSDSRRFYTRLTDLFFAIDAGNPRYDVPAYNGRLFSDSEHPFLANNSVGDSHLIPALDKLARVDVVEKRETPRRVFVDYRDLEVRHLGSIYEKLLEYELDIATEPLALKGGQYAPAKPGETVIKQPGQVYLRTGSNERKVTGSYYTPDYIVRFIVEKTLEPLLTTITRRHADLDAEGHWQVRDRDALIQDILALNVLDPATGSGHFIVDVTAYIAEWLRGLALRPADLGDEDELIYWKRQVASACAYAVDINPLAVELAKLSMWLSTLAKGKPLSFLDHHIRVGNTLVGASIFDISDDFEEEKRRKKREQRRRRDETVGQLAMFSDADFAAGVRFAVAQMNEIETTIAADVKDVKRQEQMYAALTSRLSAWKQAADVWTARAFGLEITPEQWKAVRAFSTSGMIPPNVQKIVDRAAEIARTQRFFHWDLMFPEIFFDADGRPKAQPGFDAVVGNPPYVRQERIQPIKPFLEQRYDVYSGTADLFLYFYERGLQFLKPEHRLGFITSGTYMNSNSAKPFRKHIHENAGLEALVDFGAVQPFRGVDLPTNVMVAILNRTDEKRMFRSLLIEGRKPPKSLHTALAESGFDTLPDATAAEEWRFQPTQTTLLFRKLVNTTPTLSEVCSGRIYSGIKTSLTEAFVIDSVEKAKIIELDRTSEEVIRPFLRGSDLRPWYFSDSDKYLVFTYNGINIDAYPGVKQHLNGFSTKLEKRSEVVNGSSAWYELRPCSYYNEFDQKKVFWPDIQKFPRFSWNETGTYVNDKGFFAVVPSRAVLAVLNSRAAWFVLAQIATPLAMRAGLWRYQSKIQFVERLPIPQLTTDQESSLAALAEEITALARQRYALHESFRHRIRTDLGQGRDLNTALTEWWNLSDGAALRTAVQKAFKADIPLRDRSDWEKFLAEQQSEHQRHTAAIIERETRLNAIVYDAFNLTPDERALIERTTKYPYGEV